MAPLMRDGSVGWLVCPGRKAANVEKDCKPVHGGPAGTPGLPGVQLCVPKTHTTKLGKYQKDPHPPRALHGGIKETLVKNFQIFCTVRKSRADFLARLMTI